MQKKKNKVIYYYRTDKKGTRKIFDVLAVFPKQKNCIFYNNCESIDDFFLKARYFNYTGFQKKIDSLVKNGYSLETVEGVSSKVKKEQILQALNIELPLEILSSRNRFRRTPDEYFSRSFVEKTEKYYLSGKRNDSYLHAWVELYQHVLQESIRHGDKKTAKTVLAISSCLAEFELALKESKILEGNKETEAALAARRKIMKIMSLSQKQRIKNLTKNLL